MRLLPGDHVFFVLRPEVRSLVDRVFAPRGEKPDEPLPAVEFPLSARTRVRELVEFYGIDVDAEPESSLEELLRSRLGPEPLVVGDSVTLGNVTLRVREASEDGIEVVGLQISLTDSS